MMYVLILSVIIHIKFDGSYSTSDLKLYYTVLKTQNHVINQRTQLYTKQNR